MTGYLFVKGNWLTEFNTNYYSDPPSLVNLNIDKRLLKYLMINEGNNLVNNNRWPIAMSCLKRLLK